jgi:hypothetical protein
MSGEGIVIISVGLDYWIAVTPDRDFLPEDEIVNPEFTGSIMESRDTLTSPDYYRTAATNSWKDKTQVSGGIRNLQKTFGYVSGLVVRGNPNSLMPIFVLFT